MYKRLTSAAAAAAAAAAAGRKASLKLKVRSGALYITFWIQ